MIEVKLFGYKLLKPSRVEPQSCAKKALSLKQWALELVSHHECNLAQRPMIRMHDSNSYSVALKGISKITVGIFPS